MPETTELLPFQKRLLKEKVELKDKLSKLTRFISEGEGFLKLGKEQQELLKEQCESMCEYLDILNSRMVGVVAEDTELQNKVAFEHIQSMIDSLEFKFARVEETTVTGCWAFLPNGFQVAYGESACVDPNNFDFELGKKYAKERCLQAATNKLWELEGYLLATTGVTSDYLQRQHNLKGQTPSPLRCVFTSYASHSDTWHFGEITK